MSVEIKEYNEELKRRFEVEKERLKRVLGSDVVIEHVGSSAVGIGGKNIVDSLLAQCRGGTIRHQFFAGVAGWNKSTTWVKLSINLGGKRY